MDVAPTRKFGGGGTKIALYIGVGVVVAAAALTAAILMRKKKKKEEGTV